MIEMKEKNPSNLFLFLLLIALCIVIAEKNKENKKGFNSK